MGVLFLSKHEITYTTHPQTALSSLKACEGHFFSLRVIRAHLLTTVAASALPALRPSCKARLYRLWRLRRHGVNETINKLQQALNEATSKLNYAVESLAFTQKELENSKKEI